MDATLALRKASHSGLRAIVSLLARLAPGQTLRGFRLWVDAVCINQQDNEEKNREVARMDSVYSSAESVLAWLGRHGTEGLPYSVALDTIRFIYDGIKDIGPGDPLPADWVEQARGVLDRGARSEHRSRCLGDLSFASYWSRVWVWQEMALAKSLLLFSASSVLERERFLVVLG